MTKLIAITLLLFFFSCKNDATKDKLIVELVEIINRNNKQVHNLNIEYIKAIKSRITNPRTAEKAAIWLLRAESFSEKCDNFIRLLDYYQVNINNRTYVSLLDSLKNLKNQLTSFDFISQTLFEQSISNLLTKDSILISNLRSSTTNTKTVLSKIESDILYLKNNFLSDANTGSSFIGCIYTRYEPFINISKTHFKKGDKLELIAGIANFAEPYNQKVFVDDKELKQNTFGVFEKKIVITKPNGTYNLPVKIEYKDPNTGEVRAVSKTIKYSVE